MVKEIHVAVIKKVLINTDNIVAALDLKRICERLNYSCILYKSSFANLKTLVDSLKPSLLLTDIRIKEGQDIINEVEKLCDEINLPIIFLTMEPRLSLDNSNLKNKCIIQPVPFTAEEIIHSIKTLEKNYEYH
jgi:AmiR/NasT family two-component response regulator